MNTERENILNALNTWTRQRPGLEYRNYVTSHSADSAGLAAYRAELRGITRDLHDFRVLSQAVALSGITAEQLREGFRAYSGRLTWDGSTLDYITGQYWPTEYRKAACAVLASALWDYHRDDIPAETENKGDAIRAKFHRMFGRSIAKRCFN